MEKLMALYGISSPSGREGKMAKFIIEELKKMEIPFRQDRYGNIYAVKGNRESYPCVVAHMDEVHRRKTGSYAAHLVADSMIVGYDHKRKRMTGIGADDKNGQFSPRAAFTASLSRRNASAQAGWYGTTTTCCGMTSPPFPSFSIAQGTVRSKP